MSEYRLKTVTDFYENEEDKSRKTYFLVFDDLTNLVVPYTAIVEAINDARKEAWANLNPLLKQEPERYYPDKNAQTKGKDKDGDI